jgi:hypothetical protein
LWAETRVFGSSSQEEFMVRNSHKIALVLLPFRKSEQPPCWNDGRKKLKSNDTGYVDVLNFVS